MTTYLALLRGINVGRAKRVARLLIAARLLQGLSLGGEYGTSATYLSEVATPHRRGFYSSFQYVTLTSGQLVINKSLTIQGPGANLLTVSGNNASRVFSISAGAFNVTLSGLTIANASQTLGNNR